MHWWQKELQQLEERQNKTWLLYWNQMKDKIDRGEAPDCFGRQFVEAGYRQKGISELQAAYVCGSKQYNLRQFITLDISLTPTSDD